jgi:hypothetical protein
MSDSNPRPDWYADPAGSGGERYWDGVQWTEQTRSAGSHTAPPAPPFAPQPAYQPTYVSPKSGAIAVLLTIAWLGAGHFYAGRTDTLPIVMACVNAVLWFLTFSCFVGILGWIPLVIWLSIDANKAAKDFNRRHGLEPA